MRSALAAVVLLIVGSTLSTLTQTAFSANLDRFVGDWQEDESKRQMGQTQLIFRSSATGGLEELRGAEARPVVQQVIFDGKPHRPQDGSPNSITWKQAGANSFERVFSDGKAQVITTRRIRVAADGKTLIEDTEQKTTDGRTDVTTITFQRVSGDGTGLAGRWAGRSYKSTSPNRVRYERAGNGLKFSDDVGGSYTLTFDDRLSRISGPSVNPGLMITAKLADDRTIETTFSRDGTVTARGKRVLSPDGRTITVTNTNVGPNATGQSTVLVYVKQ